MEGDGNKVAKLGAEELKECEDVVSHLALDIGGLSYKDRLLLVAQVMIRKVAF
ncbi:hypothetical protein OROGR_001477 [Orobanche gracilis]